VAGLVPLGQGPVGDHAGQLDLVFDGAVLVEVPEIAVFVVSDGSDHRDHQPSRAPDFGLAGPPVHVFPADAVVFLVQADRVLDQLRAAVVVVEPGIEVADLTEAVAAQLKAVGEHPDAVLFEHDRWLDARNLPVQPDLARGDRDHRLVGPMFGPLPEHDVRLALERRALLVAQDRILGRFPQGDVDEAGARGQAAVTPEDPARGLDLLRRQRVQRMPHPDLLGRRHRALLPGRFPPGLTAGKLVRQQDR
jgi:hypothetical protein